MRVALVTPVRDEAQNLERVAAALCAQELKPSAWVVVDDSSSDGTFELATRIARRISFMAVVSAPVGRGDDAGLATASEARAFMYGVRLIDTPDVDLIGKLDGDVILPKEYYRVIAESFARDSELGICGGRLVEWTRGRTSRIPIPPHHVHGAVKTYRRRCFERIGGVPVTLGWDTLDEANARRLGYSTRSLDELEAEHLRLWGGRSGLIRGKALLGRTAYVTHYPAEWVVARSLRSMLRPPLVVGSIAQVGGYLNAALRREPRHSDGELRVFIRRELRAREREIVVRCARRAWSAFRR